jgi:hypothetical protein
VDLRALGALLAIVIVATFAVASEDDTATARGHGHCPPTEPLERHFHNSDPRAHRQLLPGGATSVRVCRYFAGSGEVEGLPHARVGDLAGEAWLSHPRRLTRKLNRLPTERHLFNLCPFFENGPDYRLYARYRGASPVHLFGSCGYLTNGENGTKILGRLERNLEALTVRR